MQVTYTLAPDDYRHALIVYRNRSFLSHWALPSLGSLFVLLAAIQGYLELNGLAPSWMRWSLPITLFGIWFMFYFYWIAPHRSAERQFYKNPLAKEKITLHVQEGGLRFVTESSDATVSWKRYGKWLEDECVFVLFPTPQLFVTIPKRAFSPDDLPLFKETLRRNIPGPSLPTVPRS